MGCGAAVQHKLLEVDKGASSSSLQAWKDNPCADDDKKCPNVRFYRGKVKVNGGFVDDLHKWRGDYERLEVSHDYVQWFFPNYFASLFNHNAFRLTADEAAVFRTDRSIAERYLVSYEVFLDFLGLRLFDRETGSVGRQPGGEERLKLALVLRGHNLLRIRRLLASLAVTGFRHYMLPLVHHLEWEVTGGNTRLHGKVHVFDEGRRGEPALGALKGNPRALNTWMCYVDGSEVNFGKNTKAVPADARRSVLFSGGEICISGTLPPPWADDGASDLDSSRMHE